MASKWDHIGSDGISLFNWEYPNGKFHTRTAVKELQNALEERLILEPFIGVHESTINLIKNQGPWNQIGGYLTDLIYDCMLIYADHTIFNNDTSNITRAGDVLSWYDSATNAGNNNKESRLLWLGTKLGLNLTDLLNPVKYQVMTSDILSEFYILTKSMRWYLFNPSTTTNGTGNLFFDSKLNNTGNTQRDGVSDNWFSPRPGNNVAWDQAYTNDYLISSQVEVHYTPYFYGYGAANWISSEQVYYGMTSKTIDYDLSIKPFFQNKLANIFAFMDADKQAKYSGGVGGPSDRADPVFNTYGTGILEGLYTPTLSVNALKVNVSSPNIPDSVDFTGIKFPPLSPGDPRIYVYEGADFNNYKMIIDIDNDTFLEYYTP